MNRLAITIPKRRISERRRSNPCWSRRACNWFFAGIPIFGIARRSAGCTTLRPPMWATRLELDSMTQARAKLGRQASVPVAILRGERRFFLGTSIPCRPGKATLEHFLSFPAKRSPLLLFLRLKMEWLEAMHLTRANRTPRPCTLTSFGLGSHRHLGRC